MDPYQVISRPHNSEKGQMYIEDHDTYVFRVDSGATKSDIKAAVQGIWGVKVKSVRTVNVPGKTKRYGRILGRSSGWKKAIVRLQEGQAIEALK